MAESVKAAWLSSGAYLAREDRMVIRALRSWEGIVQQGDMKVTQTGSPSMAVSVAPGRAIIDGTNSPGSQGSYIVAPPETVTLPIAAAHATYHRYDLICARVYDNDFDGTGLYTWSRQVVQGTPSASPVLPSTPANALALAKVDVRNATSSILNSDITDLRNRTDHKPFQGAVYLLAADGGAYGSANRTLVSFNHTYYDPSSMWDNVNRRFAIPVSGTWSVIVQLVAAPVADAQKFQAEMWVYQPSDFTSFIAGANLVPGDTTFASTSCVSYVGQLQAGTLIWAMGYNYSTSGRSINYAGAPNYMAVSLLD